MLLALVGALFLQLSSPALAFECPKHIAAARLAIKAAMERLPRKQAVEHVAAKEAEASRARILLVNADIMLRMAAARHYSPTNPSDHGRAIAKADAARVFAVATGYLNWPRE